MSESKKLNIIIFLLVAAFILPFDTLHRLASGTREEKILDKIDNLQVTMDTATGSPYNFMSFDKYCRSVGDDGTVLGYSTTDTEAKQILCVVPTQGLVETDVLRDGRVKFTGPATSGDFVSEPNRNTVVILAKAKDEPQRLGYADIADFLKEVCSNSGSQLLAIGKIIAVLDHERSSSMINRGNPYCYNSAEHTLTLYDGYNTNNVIKVWSNFTPIR